MMNVSITQRQGLYMKQSPQQVLLSTLLQLPVLSLEQKISLELEQNPLLEEDLEMEEEMDQEMEEELKLEDMEVKQEKDDNDGEVEEEYNEDRDEVDWDTILNDENNYEIKPPKDESAETYDRPEVNQTTLPEYLLTQLNMIDLSDNEILIGEYIIWNINEVGYLTYSLDQVATNLDVTIEEAEKVLGIIQKFDPPGIGARDLQECLLIQLIEASEPDELAIIVNFDSPYLVNFGMNLIVLAFSLLWLSSDL